MEWLNYHHLLYFWLVAKEESLVRAAEKLRLAQSTVSGQIRALEQSLGEQLFVRSGRHLVLTEVGRMVFGYADEIFSMGQELQDALKGRPLNRPMKLVVGIADVLPKLVALRILSPVLTLPQPVHLVCREDRQDRLLADLSNHALDVVLSDGPVPPSSRVRAFNHLLGESAVGLFGIRVLVQPLRKRFPHSLNGAPLLLPTENSSLRRALDSWFDLQGIRPRVLGEFEDTALLKAFGQAGLGVFPAPLVIQDEIESHHGVELLGRIATVKERFFALSIERKLKHPAVVASVCPGISVSMCSK